MLDLKTMTMNQNLLKKHVYALAYFLVMPLFFSSPVQALNPGDIAFIGFDHDGGDNFAIVVLTNIGFTEIFFSDNQLNGSGDFVDNSEGTIQWTTPFAGIAAGTIVTFSGVSASIKTASVGTLANTADTGFSLTFGNDGVVAYEALGYNAVNKNWLAAYFRGSQAAAIGDFGGTGLAIGQEVLNAGPTSWDGGYYTGSLTNQSNWADYLPLINIDNSADIDPATNWEFEETDGAAASENFPTGTFALPVELSAFTATNTEDGVQLKWETITEDDNMGFEVQHSTDGKRWTDIMFIHGNGTTEEVQNYSCMDKFPTAGYNYYRLKQLDFDGGYDYSPVVVVELERSIKDISLDIGPNPTSSYLNYWFNSEALEVDIEVYAINGRLLFKLQKQSPYGRISVDQLHSGMYLLKVNTTNEVITKPFMIK